MRAEILIIDDDQDMLRLLELALSSAGFRVTCVENGPQALRYLAKGLPDLVLCDILMPDMDGYEILVMIRSNPQTNRLPVLMLSGLGQQKDVQRALEAGANSYICKPFSLRGLVKEVRSHLPAEGPVA
jgi:DNA-binding response OmpR family regulator